METPMQDPTISLATSQPVSQRDNFDNLDRVTLDDVKKSWTEYQSIRDRSAIYRFLHMVATQVDWWKRKPDEMRDAIKAAKRDNPNIKLPEDKYAAVIMLTADPKKCDAKQRSKWSRVLHYAARYKPEKELLRDFLQRKGGINKCATRYARRLRREAKPDPGQTLAYIADANSSTRKSGRGLRKQIWRGN
jgi:hypothetical protein